MPSASPFSYEPHDVPPGLEPLRQEVRAFLADFSPKWTGRQIGHSWIGFDREFSRAVAQRGWIPAKRQASISRIPSARLVLTAVQPSAQAPLPALTALGLLPNVAVLRATQVAGGMGCRGLDRGEVEFGAAVAKIRVGKSANECTAIGPSGLRCHGRYR